MKNKGKEITAKSIKSRSIETSFGNVEIDYELLGKELEDADLSEDEKKEFIDCICWIMLSFVDLGFGIEPAQQAMLAGQSNIEDGSPLKVPFADMIMASDVADDFKSSADIKSPTTNKETMNKGAET